jgi:hypothetical protein
VCSSVTLPTVVKKARSSISVASVLNICDGVTAANNIGNRQSAKTRSWEIAEEKRRERELQFKAADPSTPVEAITADPESRPTTERAVELFISDKRTQGVDAEVLGKYKRELARLNDFMGKRTKLPRRCPSHPTNTIAYWQQPFAVSLLEKGIPLEEASRLVGHTSIKTTEKHYAPGGNVGLNDNRNRISPVPINHAHMRVSMMNRSRV